MLHGRNSGKSQSRDRQRPQARAGAAAPDRAGHRRDHRGGHLRADRSGRGNLCWARGRVLLRYRRHGLLVRRPVLRRIRGDDPGRGQRLHLYLCHAGPAFRLDHRLEPGSGISRGGIDRCSGLVGLFQRLYGQTTSHARCVAILECAVLRRWRSVAVSHGIGRSSTRRTHRPDDWRIFQPAGRRARAARDHGADRWRESERELQQSDGRHQALHRRGGDIRLFLAGCARQSHSDDPAQYRFLDRC
jgi:hypothetical protein